MASEGKFRLFVYGTIKRDGCRNSAIKDQTFIREVTTKPEYALLDLGSFPGLVRVETDGKAIKGELWEIDDSRKNLLDQIEGAPNMYRLEAVNIEGEEQPVQSYFYRLRSKNTPLYEACSWDNNRSRRW